MAKQNGTEQPDLGLSLELIDLDDTLGSELETTIVNKEGNDTKDADDKEDLFKEPEGIEKGDITNLDVNKFFENKNSEPLDSTTKNDNKQQQEPTITNTKEDNKDVSGSLTVAFAKTLLETQGISEFDETKYAEAVKEKGEATAFIELLESEVAKKTESYKATLDDYSKEYIKLRDNGFTSEEASVLIGNQEMINTITEDQLKEDEELQENIIREIAELRKIDLQEVEDDIKLLKETDKLFERANKGKELLKDYYKKVADYQLQVKQQNIQKAQETRVAEQKQLKDNINSTEEIIKGKKINQQTKDKIYGMITNPIKQEDGTVLNAIWAKRNENRLEFDKKLAYLIHIGMFDGKTDTIIADAKTKAITDLERTLQSGRKFTVGTPAISSGTGTISEKLNQMDEFLKS